MLSRALSEFPSDAGALIVRWGACWQVVPANRFPAGAARRYQDPRRGQQSHEPVVVADDSGQHCPGGTWPASAAAGTQ